VVQIEAGRIQAHLDGWVGRSTAEEALNALLDAEADHLCGTRKYERTEGRKDTRAGIYDRQLQSNAGEVTLTVPELSSLPFEAAIIERNRRCESSVEKALIKVNFAGEPPSGGGHHASLVGDSDISFHAKRAEPEDLRQDQQLAGAAGQTKTKRRKI
jgi:hypothetical protein